MAKDKTPTEIKKEQITKEVEAKLAAEDLKRRLEEFSKEFFPLLKKYKIGLGAEPKCVSMNDPNHPGAFVQIAIPVWFDDTKRINEMGKSDTAKSDKDAVADIVES